MTRARVRSATRSGALRARETVAIDTSACRATSRIVTAIARLLPRSVGTVGRRQLTWTRSAAPVVVELLVTLSPGEEVNPTSYGLPVPRSTTTLLRETEDPSVVSNAGRPSFALKATLSDWNEMSPTCRSHQPYEGRVP